MSEDGMHRGVKGVGCGWSTSLVPRSVSGTQQVLCNQRRDKSDSLASNTCSGRTVLSAWSTLSPHRFSGSCCLLQTNSSLHPLGTPLPSCPLTHPVCARTSETKGKICKPQGAVEGGWREDAGQAFGEKCSKASHSFVHPLTHLFLQQILVECLLYAGTIQYRYWSTLRQGHVHEDKP